MILTNTCLYSGRRGGERGYIQIPVCITGEEVVRDDTYKYLFVFREKRW